MSVEARITSLIGASTAAGARVFGTFVPQGTMAPFVVWQRVVETPEKTHDEGAAITSTLVQVSCYANTFTASIALRDQVRAALVGNHASGPIYVESERDDYDDAASLYRADIDLTIWSSVVP